jgi:murein DD-endopeptidase MepM/ murein hydrolase activator NlpD
MTVGKGDRVRKRQLLGLLGNTGNSDGPHLHFHIMDGPSPLQPNGLPFVYYTGSPGQDS